MLTLAEKRDVNMPKYDELTVEKVFTTLQHDDHFRSYFPDLLPKGRWPDRVYFFNVLNTVYPEYC